VKSRKLVFISGLALALSNKKLNRNESTRVFLAENKSAEALKEQFKEFAFCAFFLVPISAFTTSINCNMDKLFYLAARGAGGGGIPFAGKTIYGIYKNI
jgi:hypothetical protein